MGGRWVEEEEYGRSSNLQCFLDCTTPTVETHVLPKMNGRSSNDAWQHAKMDSIKYFNLADLWEQYYEWSAYGAGATVQLYGGERVVQYYVPYLSGIQLYTNKALTASRSFGEDNDIDFLSDDEDNEKMSRSWSSTSEDSLFNCDAIGGNRKRHGHLYFEFFEDSFPKKEASAPDKLPTSQCPKRIPLMDKVHELSQGFPGLTSLRSVDLSPASWMSVAWYPIYHIPNQHNVKDLSACFLTYHTISSSFQDYPVETVANGCSPAADLKRYDALDKKTNRTLLAPFGLAAHNLQQQGSLWANPRTGDHERLVSLFGAVDSWLKQLGVQHHEFHYFITETTSRQVDEDCSIYCELELDGSYPASQRSRSRVSEQELQL